MNEKEYLEVISHTGILQHSAENIKVQKISIGAEHFPPPELLPLLAHKHVNYDQMPLFDQD